MSTDPSRDSTKDLSPEADSLDAGGDTRSATAKAVGWASRIMTISLEMVLPGLAGYWLDSVLGSKVVFMLMGFAVGGFIAFKQLLTIAKQGGRRKSHSDNPSDTNSGTSKKDKL